MTDYESSIQNQVFGSDQKINTLIEDVLQIFMQAIEGRGSWWSEVCKIWEMHVDTQ